MISDKDWFLLRKVYGDMAYECADQHEAMLALIKRPRLRLVVDNTKK